MVKHSGIVGLAGILASTVAGTAGAAEYPLFKAFPELEKRLPRVELTQGIAPLEELHGLEGVTGKSDLWVKRDDRSSEPLGGNKTRKLEFLIADARLHGATTLVTSGMYGSNHALTTAQVAHDLGLKVRLILGPQPITEDVRQKLLAFHALGAEMHFHGNKITMGLEILKYMIGGWLVNEDGVYNIPPGGSNDIGSVGYVNAFFELLEQTGPEGLPREIVLPVGTGGTTAGLLVGSCLSGQWEKVRIHGVGVVDPLLYNERKLRKDSQKLYDFIVSKLDPATRARLPVCDFRHSQKALVYMRDYYAPEYGAATPAVHEAIDLVKKTDGIVLDGTYSGKAMRHFLDAAQALKGQPGKLLFWHTYNSYPLSRIIDSYPWTDPQNKWKDLPRPFHKLFK